MIIGNIMTNNDTILVVSHYASLYKFSALIENSPEVRILKTRFDVKQVIYFV